MLYPQAITFGCDPEFFFARKTKKGKAGKILGAEKIIPEKGLVLDKAGMYSGGKTIIDGVQAELNPKPFACRAYMGDNLSYLFRDVAKNLKRGVGINWNPLVKVTPTEMKSLSEKNRILGCSPSINAYGEPKEMPDANKYMFRSAGGHIHIGIGTIKSVEQAARVVKVLDIIVGNTCVLIDRDKGNIERRKVYGRAGEFRKPTHGIEYRVLSNFWLKHYVLMSMVFGLTRLGISFAMDEKESKRLMELVKEEDIRNAINNNDFDLAKANFEKIKPLIEEVSGINQSLHKGNLAAFDYVVCKGIGHWIKGDPLKHWTEVGAAGFNAHGRYGWESFLALTIAPKIKKHAAAAKVS